MGGGVTVGVFFSLIFPTCFFFFFSGKAHWIEWCRWLAWIALFIILDLEFLKYLSYSNHSSKDQTKRGSLRSASACSSKYFQLSLGKNTVITYLGFRALASYLLNSRRISFQSTTNKRHFLWAWIYVFPKTFHGFLVQNINRIGWSRTLKWHGISSIFVSYLYSQDHANNQIYS